MRETIGDAAATREARVGRDRAQRAGDPEPAPIVIVACGTAYHAGVVGDTSSRVGAHSGRAGHRERVRYRNPVLSKDTLVIGITQSGETADTIAAMRLAREQGARTLAITNQLGTQITREVDAVLYTRAGLEVGRRGDEDIHRASRTPVADRAQARADPAHAAGGRDRIHHRGALRPAEKMERFLDADHPIEEIAQRHYNKPFFLYPGDIWFARRPRRCAEVEGDLLHPDRGVLGRRDEARPDRSPRLRDTVVCIAIDQKVVYEKVSRTSRR